MALRWRATAVSRMATSSACCCLVVSPGRDGQSILLTVATHSPRNSRAGAGGSSPAALAARPREARNAQKCPARIAPLDIQAALKHGEKIGEQGGVVLL